MLRPGGKLAITSWGARVFKPDNQAFWHVIQSECLELYRESTPWDRIDNPASIGALLASGGATNVEVAAEIDTHNLNRPEDWWTMMMGGRFRGTIEKLDAAARERVRASNLAFLCSYQIQALDSDILYAVAKK